MSGEITKAICAVMADVPYVQKTGRNDFHRFDYASEADLLHALQPAMAKHGLSLAPTTIERIATVGTTSKGKPSLLTTLIVGYRLSHTSGETMDLMGIGEGADGEDKGAYKAMTGALKYVLRSLFLLPTGTDPDAVSGNHNAAPAPRQHSPAWKQIGKAMCAKLTEAGYDYNDVAAWCESKGWGRPSGWPDADHIRHMVDDVTSGGTACPRKS